MAEKFAELCVSPEKIYHQRKHHPPALLDCKSLSLEIRHNYAKNSYFGKQVEIILSSSRSYENYL